MVGSGIAGLTAALRARALEAGAPDNVTCVVASLGNDIALGVNCVSSEATSVDGVLHVGVTDELTGCVSGSDRQVETLGGATVLFADDDILRDVDETTSEVTGVCSTQSGVSQTLTSTVGSDEVLHNGETFTVRVDDRTRDNFTLRVVHQTTHTRDVTNLQPVTTST